MNANDHRAASVWGALPWGEEKGGISRWITNISRRQEKQAGAKARHAYFLGDSSINKPVPIYYGLSRNLLIILGVTA